MSDTTTPPAPDPAPDLSGLDQGTLSRLIAQLTGPQAPPPVVSGSASSHDGRGFLSLLGEALGGGQQYGTTEEREQGGLAAAQAAGIRMLAASDYSRQPHTLGAIVAQGLGGAQQSLGQTQSVSAARQAAAFEQNRQQQQDQLARIKEALPLLTLQQRMRAAASLPATLDGSSGSIATGGSLGSVSVPPEYLPFYQEASARTGIPVEVLIAQGRQESGFNPGATGAAGEIGIGQINPKTATDPGYGMTGLKNPAVLRDPRTNINFQADYLAARAKAAGADFSTPEGIAKALKAYNGGGDPNYVQNVTRYIPGARTALAPRPVPGQTAAPGQPPTPPPTQARPVLPPPEAPLAPGAGGALVAGGPGAPGAPTSGVIPPSPPGSGADVADIVSGMVARGADPTTLAPGPGSAPAPAGATVAGPAAPPDPDSYEAHKLLHPITPGPAQQRLFNPQPDPGQMAAIAEQKRNAERLFQEGKLGADPLAAAQKAREALIKANADEATLRENARKLGTETEAKWYEQQDRQRFEAWTAQRADARQQAQKQADQAAALALEAARAEEARKTAAAATEGTRVSKQRDEFDTARDQIRNNIDNFQMLKAFSDAAGKSTPLENFDYGGHTGRDILVSAGLGTQAQKEKWGAQQAFEGLINKTIMGLRSGFSMGSLSDGDMRFLQHLGPSQLQDPATRADVISYLEQSEFRKRDFMNKVEDFYDDGKGMTWAQARRKAEASLPDYVVKMPDDFGARSPADQHQFLRQNNLRHGNLVRLPNGSLSRIEIGQ